MSDGHRFQLFRADGVGETRWVWATAAGEPVRIHISRVTDPPGRPALGRAFVGRVTSIVPSMGGAFVDIGGNGAKPAGFLPFKKGVAPKGLSEGALVRVQIAAEPFGEKAARLRRLPGAPVDQAVGPDGPVPDAMAVMTSNMGCQTPQGILSAAALDRASGTPPVPGSDLQSNRRSEPGSQPGSEPKLAGGSEIPDDAPAITTGGQAHALADHALAEATSPTIGLPDGGDICIQPTRALVAVDIDAGTHITASTGGAGKLALRVNRAAAPVIARQIGLRRLGGVVVVDCVSMRHPADRASVQAAFVEAFAGYGLKADVGPLSRNGLCEIVVPRGQAPLTDQVCASNGALSLDTHGFAALGRLRREGEAMRAAQLDLVVSPDVMAWLEAVAFDWRAAVTAIIGARFCVSTQPDLPDAGAFVRCR